MIVLRDGTQRFSFKDFYTGQVGMYGLDWGSLLPTQQILETNTRRSIHTMLKPMSSNDGENKIIK